MSLEAYNVLNQINDQTSRLVRNFRANANGYITTATAITAGTSSYTVSSLASQMKADATAFNVRIQTMTDIASRNPTLVTSALAIISVTLAQVNVLKTTLLDATSHVLNATYNVPQDCIDAANYVLTNVPIYDGLY